MTNLTVAVKDYFKEYTVEDIYDEETKLLFILESPHTQEIKYGYPVAGNSGLEMTKFIYEPKHQKPLGKLVANKEEYKANYNNLEKFGLLNVSPAPMQEQALKKKDLTKSEFDVLEILEKLRVNYKAKRHQKQEWNLVKEIVLNNFKQRLVTALKDHPQINYLVPCGRFATSYLDLIDDPVVDSKEVIADIPHPSFNQWQRYELMDKLEHVLNKI
ncbi:hypothetical protein Halha_1685 [Halobacteroides halobius DSM 5150]|uniref:Uracil DNA glycosylase superfamily protein n=1 Tax=Halobacteroides halobius (strain ATCC 35273 / DSM 5150 / MD-1) TaxID=748449 RepID=L0K8K6_HALHC|nr:hypothetical protein [Halobacteroides halobius]AGB41622.1 hypothetical protein Halha_1685 [Halobacteroides halobius DSM 5150]